MASKIKVDQIEGSTASTITLPSGQTLDLSSGSLTLPDGAVDLSTAKVTGTLGSGNLPTIPVSKGGTGLTSLGTAGQALKVNSGGTALEFGSAGSSTLLGSGESLSTTSQVINNTILTSEYEVFDIYVFMSKVGSGGSGNREMFVSTTNGSSTDNVDRLYHFAQLQPGAGTGHGLSNAGVNQDRINMNVNGVVGDYHNAKIELFRPKFASAGERNRNTILIESVSCQNPGTGINVENVTTFACIHEGSANKNNDIDYVRFEYNGSTFDIKWAVYGRKW